MVEKPLVILVDLDNGGHHHIYLESTARAVRALGFDCAGVVASREMRESFILGCDNADAKCELVPRPGAFRSYVGAFRAIIPALRGCRQSIKAIAGKRRCLPVFLWFDQLLLPGPWGAVTFDLLLQNRYSGVWFHPREIQTDLLGRGIRKGIRSRHWVKYSKLCHRIGVLDERVIPMGSAKAHKWVHFPDICNIAGLFPVKDRPPNGKRRLVAVGTIQKRKGIGDLLALAEHAAGKLEIVIAGSLSESDAAEMPGGSVAKLMECAERKLIDLRLGRLSEAEVNRTISESDIVWLGYSDFQSPSNILIKAFAACKPAIGCTEGWIGHTLRSIGGGETLDTRDPATMYDQVTRLAQKHYQVDRAEACKLVDFCTNTARLNNAVSRLLG